MTREEWKKIRDEEKKQEELNMRLREYYKDDPEKQNTAQCIIAKNRHGSTGKADLGWYGQYTKFISVDTAHNE